MPDTKELPKPLTPADCDCRNLDGFMLNVERLMASELVALSSHEVIGAALLLWCRAWKQTPAASLPDDDRVNAAFSKLPLGRFRKLKSEIMRGFQKCSDGRLYHRHLSQDALKAFGKSQEFQNSRENNNARQARWRARVREICAELRALGITPPTNASLEVLEATLADAKASTVDGAVDGPVDEDVDAKQASTVDATETAPRRLRQGQGQGQGHSFNNNAGEANDVEAAFADAGIDPPGSEPAKSLGEIEVETLLRANNGSLKYGLSGTHRAELARLCDLDGVDAFREAWALANGASPRREGKGFVGYVAAVLGDRAGKKRGKSHGKQRTTAVDRGEHVEPERDLPVI